MSTVSLVPQHACGHNGCANDENNNFWSNAPPAQRRYLTGAIWTLSNTYSSLGDHQPSSLSPFQISIESHWVIIHISRFRNVYKCIFHIAYKFYPSILNTLIYLLVCRRNWRNRASFKVSENSTAGFQNSIHRIALLITLTGWNQLMCQCQLNPSVNSIVNWAQPPAPQWAWEPSAQYGWSWLEYLWDQLRPMVLFYSIPRRYLPQSVGKLTTIGHVYLRLLELAILWEYGMGNFHYSGRQRYR